MSSAERQISCAEPQGASGTASMRDRILTCARSLFANRGFDATSVRQIAEAVGVTVPALYYHFDSKRALLTALAEDHCLRKAASVEAGLKHQGDALSRFERALSSYMEFMVGERETARITMRDPTLLSDPILFALVTESESRVAGMLAGLIQEGVSEGAFATDDPNLTAYLLLAAARSVALSRTLGGQSGPIPATADDDAMSTALIGLVTEGLLARPSSEAHRELGNKSVKKA